MVVKLHGSQNSDLINRLTVVPHTWQAPVSNRSPLTTSPRKSMIVVAWRQREQNTFASTFACAQAGTFRHRAAAAGVNWGVGIRIGHGCHLKYYAAELAVYGETTICPP